MRTNLPVTDTEIKVPSNIYLVSQTNLKSIITEANDAFVEISGYTQEELIGQPQNIVRHPDMPSAVFSDMWATLEADQPWRGTVKNRSKDGSFYWVDALITPFTRAGIKEGYLSVRRAATAQQIAEAETLYSRLKSGKKKPFNKIKALKIKTTIYSLGALAIVANVGGYFAPDGSALHEVLFVTPTVAMIVIACILHKKVFAPLVNLRRVLSMLAEGNLLERNPVAKPDEIGLLVNMASIMQLRWLATIDNVRSIISNTLITVENISAQGNSINEQVGFQYDQISDSAAATEEFSQTVAEVASHASETAIAATNSNALIEQGKQTMMHGLQSMSQVVVAVKESNLELMRLEDAVETIGSLAHVIKEIADQTNLLALNAAIEAARAGEQGRGFAVVADEVRKLAERTTGSTLQINKTVDGIKQLADAVIHTMSQAANAVDNSSAKISETSSQLDIVASASLDTVSLATHISSSAGQQNIASQEVAKKMENIANLAEMNRNEVSALAISLQDVRDGISSVLDAMDRFKVADETAEGESVVRLKPEQQINKAITAHGAWKMKLNKTIKTGKTDVPVEIISKDNECAFGKWLHDKNLPLKVKSSQRYRSIVDLHARFHQSAGGIAKCACNGQVERAQQLMLIGGDFYTTSAELVKNLELWKSELN